MIPCIMWDAFDSPGWTREEMTTPLRLAIASGSAIKEVTVRTSTVLPESVSQSGRRRKRLEMEGSASRPRR